MKHKNVIYTCLTNSYDALSPATNQKCDCICFCDKESYELNKQVEGWSFRIVNNPTFNPKQINRDYKMNPHKFLKDYNHSIYIDSNIILKKDLSPFFEYAYDQFSIYLYNHPDRNCAYKEIIKLAEVGLIEGDYAKRWFNFLKKEKLSQNNGFYECNIILRKHNENQCIKAMVQWSELYKSWNLRDQPSFALIANNFNEILFGLGQAKIREGENEYFSIKLHHKKNPRLPRLFKRLVSEFNGSLQHMRSKIIR